MRAAVFVLAMTMLFAASARAQDCTLQRFDRWGSKFDLTPLNIPIIINTHVSFDDAGTFDAISSFEGDCFIDANGTYSFVNPDLVIDSVSVGTARPNPTSVPCELLHVASLAIGDDALLPSSNITFSSDCTSFNMTFYDNVGIPRTRQFTQFSQALILVPSIIVFLVSVALLF